MGTTRKMYRFGNYSTNSSLDGSDAFEVYERVTYGLTEILHEVQLKVGVNLQL